MSSTHGKLGWKDLANSRPSGSVLIVDDDAPMRKSLQRLVTRLGFSAHIASSAEEADHWLASQRFEVCILDIDLPRMKGVEFLDWVLKRDSEMAVIMVTGFDLPELAIECIDGGARTYLVKPVDADFMRIALRDAVMTRSLLVERNELVSRGVH